MNTDEGIVVELYGQEQQSSSDRIIEQPMANEESQKASFEYIDKEEVTVPLASQKLNPIKLQDGSNADV